ncbi:MAG: hypothetical protein HY305_01995 [Sphingobacteriales bacterium]|nr:hypothetical protein [Sphingobacteriales bacterium]
MRKQILYISLALICFSCKKGTPLKPIFPFNGTVVKFTPVSVTKTSNKKVFVHLMPWFDTPESIGQWGIHWTMGLGSTYPNTTANGKRNIATHYYPLIGPYASKDYAVIDYQLQMMKLSGIDGVFIDWSGTSAASEDLAYVKLNTDAIVARLGIAGMKYAIVYEDQYLKTYSDPIARARIDMNYLKDHFFNDSNYEKIGAAPLLMVFGPQLLVGAQWDSAFSVLPTKPAFLPLWGQSYKASTTASGEFAWINQDNQASLNRFYGNTYTGMKIASAYPGFNSFYKEGGWPGPQWIIAANGVANFEQTLDLALATSYNYLQLCTWNDYGEGTMLEPTEEFKYTLLTTLQQKLGVSDLTQSDLEAAARLYALRKANAGNTDALKKLDQGFYYIASLQMDKAKALLASF